MSDEDVTERCTRCGTEFPASSSPLGLCPACLLKLGMSDVAMVPPADGVQEVEPAAPMSPLPAVLPPRRSRRLSFRTLATVFGIAAISAAVLFFFLRPRHEAVDSHASPVRFTLTLPDGIEMPDAAQFAVSADGGQLAVAARSAEGQQRLWIRRLESFEWRELPRTDGASHPFWSPDGRSIAFFAHRSLKRTDVSSDLTYTVCEAPPGQGGSWSRDGIIVFATAAGLFRVPASGGSPESVTQVDKARGELAHLWPHFLPDGRRVVFVAQQEKGGTRAHILDLNRSRSLPIAEGAGQIALVSDLLLFSRGTGLTAQRIDVPRARVRGDAESIGGTDSIRSSATFSVSSTVLVYLPYEPRSSQLMWLDRSGRALGAVGAPADIGSFALAPDGRRVAIVRRDERDESSKIWLVDVHSERSSRLTLGQTHDTSLVWSPDGSRLAFSSRRENSDGVYVVGVNGGESEEALFRSTESKRVSDWSRDGQLLIYTAGSANAGTDVWAVPLGADAKPLPVDVSSGNQSQAVLSPDMRLIAYVSDESGSDEVFVRAFPSGGKWQISAHGGTRPQWRADGRELFFLSAGRVMAVDIAQGAELRFSGPRALFVVPGSDDFAVQHDRFLVRMPLENRRGRELHVILNWASELLSLRKGN